MRNFVYAMALSLSALLAAEPAHACRMNAELRPEVITRATVVVVGRIFDYEIVFDQAARQRRDEWIARSPDMPADQRKSLLEQKGFLSDYARFKVHVDEVLVGHPPKTLVVTWNNSTFGEPAEMDAGPFLIGLIDSNPKSPAVQDPSPAVQDPSATPLPSGRPKPLTVLQSPCAPPFILENAGAETKAVREILKKPAE